MLELAYNICVAYRQLLGKRQASHIQSPDRKLVDKIREPNHVQTWYRSYTKPHHMQHNSTHRQLCVYCIHLWLQMVRILNWTDVENLFDLLQLIIKNNLILYTCARSLSALFSQHSELFLSQNHAPFVVGLVDSHGE